MRTAVEAMSLGSLAMRSLVEAALRYAHPRGLARTLLSVTTKDHRAIFGQHPPWARPLLFALRPDNAPPRGRPHQSTTLQMQGCQLSRIERETRAILTLITEFTTLKK